LQSGIEPYELLAELCHRADGVNGGRAGSALVMAPRHRFLCENSIVGAGIPIACGAAMAAVAQGSDRVVVVSFGDGATSQEALREGLVLAAARRLPVLFICENNSWSEMTPVSEMVPLDRIAWSAGWYGIRGFTIDGTDPLAVRDTAALAVAGLRAGLAARPEVLVCGEEVGKAGGIFAATRSLQREFGADRVFDMPIAESAILGSAVGAAMCGQRPDVEIMWADFLLVALGQLINQAANVRYLTRDRFSAPLVVRTQHGATPGSCAQHSQSLEALLAHIPGLCVGLPTTPQDVYDMLRAAVADPDPCIIESRALHQTKASVTLAATPGPVGSAALRVSGRDVALVGWGAVMAQLLEASRQLGQDVIEAAVLDLRWFSPFDDAALSAAVMGCHSRAVIAHDANLTGGFGAEIAARLHEQHGPGAIQICRVASPDIRVPAAPLLQRASLPDAAAVVRAAKSLVPARVLEAEPV